MPRTKKDKTPKTQSETEVRVNFQPIPNENTPIYYTNYIEVSHTIYEFVLTFAKIPSKLKPEEYSLAKKNQKVPIDPMLQVDVPPLLIPGLIQALTTQKEKYEARGIDLTLKKNNKINHKGRN